MKPTKKSLGDLPVVAFENQKAWAIWLAKNHTASPGLWLQLAKKASGIPSISYAEALEAALCYGWIDGQKNSYDEKSWLQKFTLRGARSVWSKINRDKAERLIKDGQMKPAGLKAVEVAKQNGQWDAAYDGQSKATVPDDLQAALNKSAQAKAFFATLNSRNRYAILFQIHTAKKAETRARRIQQFVVMLEKKELLYP